MITSGATQLIARGRPTRLNSEEIGNPTEKQVLGPRHAKDRKCSESAWPPYSVDFVVMMQNATKYGGQRKVLVTTKIEFACEWHPQH